MLAASLVDESSKFEVNWVSYFSSVCHREPIKRPPDEADPPQLAETVKVSFFFIAARLLENSVAPRKEDSGLNHVEQILQKQQIFKKF